MTIEPYVPANYANVRYRFACAGVTNEMGFSIGFTHLVTEPDDIAERAAISFRNHVLDDGAFLGSEWTFLGTISYRPVPGSGVVVTEYPLSLDGGFSANTIPPNCSFLLQKRTGLAGRRNRGRIFCPPFNITDVDVDAAGMMSGTLVASHGLLWNAHREDMAAQTSVMVLFHSHETDTVGDEFEPTTIVNLVAQAQLATQRRRLR